MLRDPFAPPQHVRDPAVPPPGRPPMPGGFSTEPVAAVDGEGCEGGLRRHQQREASKHNGPGSLIVVDIGITAVNHVTIEGQRWIEQSDRVLYFGADPVAERWIGTRNAKLVSLNSFADPSKSALQIVNELVEQTLEYVRAGLSVCAAYHRHSAAASHAAHESMRKCRAEGYRAAMLPGISLEDSLIADLALELRRTGCQIFDCCDFLEQRRQPDMAAGLILWLPSLVRDANSGANGDLIRCDPALAAVLCAAYGPDHEVVLHGPARYAVCDPVIHRCRVGELSRADITAVSSLYVPPKKAPSVQSDALRSIGAGLDALQ